MIDMNMKWNKYPSDTLYLWNGKTLFKIAEGTGDNLLEEDEAEGYKDYWMTDYYDFDEWEGGQWMERETIWDLDYTIQGVLDRLKECDLWDDDWEILDDNTGSELEATFELYWEEESKAFRAKRRIEEMIKQITKGE